VSGPTSAEQPGAADWRPTATLDALRQRAVLVARTREFFAARGVLEVETPVLSTGAPTDPQIESLATRVAGIEREFFLSTSPEFPMKRLIAAGSGDIYQLCKVFRDGERGRWHNPEFTLLEWYRLGFDEAALMSEVEALVASLLAPGRHLEPAERLTYAEAILRHAGVNPHTAGSVDLERAAEAHGVACRAELDRDAKLDLLMGLVVGPMLGRGRPCFVCDYPAQARTAAGCRALRALSRRDRARKRLS
jgi:lysyl-tRNA synthetase class 2